MNKLEASKGIFWMFIAELLAVGALIVSGIISAESLGITGDVTIVMDILILVFGIGGFILALLGMSKAGKADRSFIYARDILIGVFIANMIIMILNACNVFDETLSMSSYLVRIFDIATICFTFMGLRNLVSENKKLCNFLIASEIIYASAYAISAITGLVASCNADIWAIFVLLVVSAITAIVGEIFVIISYGRTASTLRK